MYGEENYHRLMEKAQEIRGIAIENQSAPMR
jgi:hypothetical protein